jgi:hypothetical protein
VPVVEREHGTPFSLVAELRRKRRIMKTKIIAVLVTVAASLGWQAAAQTAQASSPYWVVKGQVYDINKSSLWTRFDGTILKVLTNGLVVETFTVETKQQAVVVRRLKANSYMTTDESKKYHDVTEMVDVGTKRVPGKKIIIRNYPTDESPAVGKTIAFYAMQTETSDYNGDKLELWDLGTPPTAEDFRKLKADADERQRAAQNQLDEQRRVATEKKAAAKNAAKAKLLKSFQDMADKGDSYGLLRMGECYRDGDGVPGIYTGCQEPIP